MQIKINIDFLLSIVTVIIPILLQLIYIRYVSYSVDKTIYGNFVLLQTLIVALSYIFLQIPGQAYSRFYNSVKDKVEFVNEFRTLLIFINILSFFLIIIYGYVMEKFDNETLFLLFIYFVILNNYTFNQQIFLFNLDRKKYLVLKILEAMSKFLFPILFYLYYQSLVSFIIGLAVGYSFSFVFLHKYLKYYPFKFTINYINLKKYFIFAYPIFFVSIFSWGISFSDRYFIDYYMGSKDVALYAILAQVTGVGSIIGQIYFMYAEPRILKKFNEDPELTFRMINSYLKKIVVVFCFLLIIAFVLPKEIYTILLNKDIVENDYYFKTMMILLVASFVNILHIAHHMHLKLRNRLDILAYVFLVGFIVNLMGNMFIQQYGIIAAAIATLLAYITILVLQILYISKNRYRGIGQ